MPPHRFDLRLGVDVGGTNTDTVVIDREDRLLGKAKVPTTPDVSSGIQASIESVLALDTVDVSRITHVMLGTTHATNAVIERNALQRVAVIRIGSPATHSVRPLFGWPGELRAAIAVDETIVPGGVVHVSLSHQVGSIGLLERENATVLNAALIGVAGQVSEALQKALAAHDLSPVTFFAQNDGTLMALDYARRMPVLTI